MRVKIRNAIIVLVAYLLLASSLSVHAALDPDESKYMDNYKSIMQVMQEEMTNAPKTGDPSLDFLYEMIPHHEGAISMSENLLDYGTNLEMKNLAAAIVKEQLLAVKQMKALLDKLKDDPQVDKKKELEYLKGYEKAYKEMMDEMDEVKPTGNIDLDYLEAMIPHHEAGIAMASNILKYTNNKELQKIANQIIANQSKQVKQMEKLEEGLED
ncbi:DUF305 domain-containing protein [Bacillus sp. AGMB 02131]|uniref:DUF305 domain-containing protein n=1 Tax=Peribacillus faecalis TaxID=2772559 RepID=A0A927CW16_9BACI|nr:DUF305 domain-containing protein [Peribacillus faecalis]MBD3107005.1 DUF305 domain-containing protein [Peribacillus faecalis]